MKTKILKIGRKLKIQVLNLKNINHKIDVVEIKLQLILYCTNRLPTFEHITLSTLTSNLTGVDYR